MWYIDDNALSHIDSKVITKVLEIMKGHLGDLVKLRVGQGNKSDFLGMGITITEYKKKLRNKGTTN